MYDQYRKLFFEIVKKCSFLFLYCKSNKKIRKKFYFFSIYKVIKIKKAKNSIISVETSISVLAFIYKENILKMYKKYIFKKSKKIKIYKSKNVKFLKKIKK